LPIADAGGVGNCGYTKETEEKAIAEGHADLISSGRPFISNPDLVERFRNGCRWRTSAGVRLVVAHRAKGYTHFRPTHIRPPEAKIGRNSTNQATLDAKKETSHVQHIDLLTRNLQDVFGENDPGVGGRHRGNYSEDGIFYDPTSGRTVAATRSIAVAGAIRATHPDFDISQLPSPRSWATAGGSSGYRPPGEAPTYAGLILIVSRICRLYLFSISSLSWRSDTETPQRRSTISERRCDWIKRAMLKSRRRGCRRTCSAVITNRGQCRSLSRRGDDAVLGQTRRKCWSSGPSRSATTSPRRGLVRGPIQRYDGQPELTVWERLHVEAFPVGVIASVGHIDRGRADRRRS